MIVATTLVNPLESFTPYLAAWVEGGAAIIIALAALEGVIRALWIFLHPSSPPQDKELVRLRLGRWLSLGLEFELAADIMRTALAPTWDDIGRLAAIIILRTVLNYFLQRDIDKAEQRREAQASA